MSGLFSIKSAGRFTTYLPAPLLLMSEFKELTVQVYLLENNQKNGPFDVSEIRSRYSQGTLSPNSQVWWQGASDWIAVTQFIQMQEPTANAPAVYTPQSFPMAQPATHGSVVIIRDAPIPTHVQASVGAPRGSGLAMASLICGLLSFFFFVPAIPAVILGHMARSQTSRDPSLTGRGMGTAGMIIGYVIILGALASGLFFLLFVVFAGIVASSGH
jgi:hypothetical protein